MDFQFLLSTKIIMQAGLRAHTGEHLKELGLQHVLLVTDQGVKRAGVLDSIYSSLDTAEVRYSEVCDVKPNPRADDCNAAAQQYRVFSLRTTLLQNFVGSTDSL